MSVKKRINASVESFIDKGADVKAMKERGFKNVLVRIPSDILDQLDVLIGKRPWTNRTQLIVEAIHEKLKKEE